MKSLLIGFILTLSLSSQVLATDGGAQVYKDKYFKSEVIKVESEDVVDGSKTQNIKVKVLDGDREGEFLDVNNDSIQLQEGQKFYLRIITSENGEEYITVSEVTREGVIYVLMILFVLALLTFGGGPGIRGLMALLGSLYVIFYLLVPGVYAGYNAFLVSALVAGFIIVLGSYITHGFNKITSAAVLGMLGSVLITGLIAYISIKMGSFTGLSSEEGVYLKSATASRIDMVGLLYGGIIIGLLGVLYDIAIGQAVAVAELRRARADMSRREIYKRGLKIGREHIGALVNTLAIAYVGASLPLILLIQSSGAPLMYMINSELFATEILRILVGSIGLIIAVPITTLIAALTLKDIPDHLHGSHGHGG